jgi:hypothetical protein
MSISEARNAVPRVRPGYVQAHRPLAFSKEGSLERLLANAKRARWEADNMTSGALRQQLLEIAHGYEEMAKTLEISWQQRRTL